MKTTDITRNPQGGHPQRLSLAPRQVFATSEAKGHALEALKGSVWVTLDDGGADHILKPGDRLSIGDSRRVVVEALTHSEIGFSRQAPGQLLAGITPTRYAEDCWACI